MKELAISSISLYPTNNGWHIVANIDDVDETGNATEYNREEYVALDDEGVVSVLRGINEAISQENSRRQQSSQPIPKTNDDQTTE